MSHVSAGPSPQNDAFLEFPPEERKERKEDREENKRERFEFVVKAPPWSRSSQTDALSLHNRTRELIPSVALPQKQTRWKRIPDFTRRATTLRVWLFLYAGEQIVRMRARVARMTAAAAAFATASRAKAMPAAGRVAEALHDASASFVELVRAHIHVSRPAAFTSWPVLSFICGIALGGLAVSVIGHTLHPRESGSAPASVKTQPALVDQRVVQASPSVEPLVIPAADSSPRVSALTNDSGRPRVQRAVRDAKLGSETRGLTVLPSAAPFRGSLSISSSPAGAEVTMNGRPVGTTPLLLANVPAGSRVVQVSLDGYQPWSSGIRVVADERTSVKATLVRAFGR